MPEVRSLRGLLPLELPFPCPICGAKVRLTAVTEWGTDDGHIEFAEYECETEPDIDSGDWPDWHRGHYAMPYVDWLPWENRMLTWLNRNYHYRDEAGEDLEVPRGRGTSS
jgi:hypothetical protein